MYKCMSMYLIIHSFTVADYKSRKKSHWETHKWSGAESNNFPAGLELQAGMSVNMLPSCHACRHTCWAEGCSCWKLLFTACVLLSSIQVLKTLRKMFYSLKICDPVGQGLIQFRGFGASQRKKMKALKCVVAPTGFISTFLRPGKPRS